MGEDLEDGHRLGDKVRVKVRPGDPERGIIREVSKAWLRVETNDGETVLVPPDSVTNYSLAARRAWRTMPKRAGRRRGDVAPSRMVSLRLSADVIELLHRAADLGRIGSREQAINNWLRERLLELTDGHQSDPGNPGN